LILLSFPELGPAATPVALGFFLFRDRVRNKPPAKTFRGDEKVRRMRKTKADPEMLDELSPIDRYVGSRLRMRRMMLGISQGKLGKALGVTFQQVQKYEKGTNRISASKLQQAASILHVPVAFFFEGGPSEVESGGAVHPREWPAGFAEFLTNTEGLDLTKAFRRITSPRARRQLISLVEALAEPDMAPV
jgi:transcriptional regulator with XRE-family HTH domain